MDNNVYAINDNAPKFDSTQMIVTEIYGYGEPEHGDVIIDFSGNSKKNVLDNIEVLENLEPENKVTLIINAAKKPLYRATRMYRAYFAYSEVVGFIENLTFLDKGE